MDLRVIRQKHRGRVYVAAFVCLSLLAACLPKGPVPPEEEAVSATQGQRVLAVMTSMEEIPLVHKSNGVIIPSDSVTIQAASDGLIERVLVREGQKVTAGTQLITIDNEQDKARLEFIQTEVEEAEAAVELDQYRFDNRDALLDEEEITSTVYDMLERKLEHEKARVKRAKAEVTYLQKVTSATDIVSPISGTVTQRKVSDQMHVIEGQSLLEIIQDDPLRLQVRLPEDFIPATYRGQFLQIQLPTVTEEQTVKITDVGLEVDPLTRTFDVFAKIENPEGRLKSGMEIPVTLVTDKKTRLLAIPKSAVALRNKRPVVFKIIDGKAQMTRVRLGQTVDSEVGVLSGLVEGDIIVLDPPTNLQDGDAVEIQTAAAPSTS